MTTKRFLIVEDESSSRKMLTRYLEPYAAIVTALNGREAVTEVTSALAKAEPFDLICMDIRMPEMDGQQALVEIRRLESEYGYRYRDAMKIVMVTCFDDSDHVLPAFRSQCDGYLSKPLDRKKIIGMLCEQGLIRQEDTNSD